MLTKLERCGIKLKKSKCAIVLPQIEYFAFIVDRHGIHPLPTKVQPILEVQEPQNKIELQSFLGLVNYYWKFILNMSTLVSLLNKLLAKDTMVLESRVCQIVSGSKGLSYLIPCVSPLQS